MHKWTTRSGYLSVGFWGMRIVNLQPDLTENRDVVWNSNVNIPRLPNREYLIRGKTIDPSEHEGWVLVVSDPATALQCARSGWGPRKLDIVRELVHRGIQFNTMES